MFEQTKALCSSFLKLGIPGFDLAVNQYEAVFADLEERTLPLPKTITPDHLTY